MYMFSQYEEMNDARQKNGDLRQLSPGLFAFPTHGSPGTSTVEGFPTLFVF